MENYKTILNQFISQGLTEYSEVTQHEITKALNAIHFQNTAKPFFDSVVQAELWNQTLDNLQGDQVKVKNYVHTIIRAQIVLRQRVDGLQQQLRFEKDEKRKEELLEDLCSCIKDHGTISSTFGLEKIQESQFIRESQKYDIKRGNSFLFSIEVDERQESTDLKVVFLLTLLIVGFQLLAMFNKHHFFSLLGSLLLVSSFILKYFEKKYVQIMLVWFAVSVVFDIIWMVFKSEAYWFSGEGTTFSSYRSLYLKLVLVFVACEIVMKFVLICLLFKYRQIPENIKKKISFGDLVLHLDGKADANNLIVRAVTQTGTPHPFTKEDF